MGGRTGSDLKKQADDLKRALRKHPAKGRVHIERGSKHSKVYRFGTRDVITTIPDTPSDYRSLRNVMAVLKREGVFGKSAVEGLNLSHVAPSQKTVEDAMLILQFLGWRPGQIGRAGGSIRRFGEIMHEVAIETEGVDANESSDFYAQRISACILKGKEMTHENMDLLTAAIDRAFETLNIPSDWKPEAVEEAIAATVNGNGDHPVPEVEVEPTEVEVEKIGPLYGTIKKVDEDSLFIRVMAAIMQNDVDSKVAIALALEVARMEGL